MIKINELLERCRGRETEILTYFGCPAEIIRWPKREHPCPRCGGTTRCRLINAKTGVLFCSHCFRNKSDGNYGDLISSVQWLSEKSFAESLKAISNYLNLKKELE